MAFPPDSHCIFLRFGSLPSQSRFSPTPAIAAKAKIPRCYTGPLTSPIARSMMSCDVRAPLMIHVTKLYAAPNGQSFSAYGRIYSGTVKPGKRMDFRYRQWIQNGFVCSTFCFVFLF